jgi:hypothetical protein
MEAIAPSNASNIKLLVVDIFRSGAMVKVLTDYPRTCAEFEMDTQGMTGAFCRKTSKGDYSASEIKILTISGFPSKTLTIVGLGSLIIGGRLMIVTSTG